jgi:hypothetical protein
MATLQEQQEQKNEYQQSQLQQLQQQLQQKTDYDKKWLAKPPAWERASWQEHWKRIEDEIEKECTSHHWRKKKSKTDDNGDVE